MNMALISNENVVEHFAPGGKHDGICVFDVRGRNIGFITDLRLSMAREAKNKANQKARSDKMTAERREKMQPAVEEMVEYLKNQLAKYDAEIFINQTQPNVVLNGHKCYITVEPIYNQHRLGIMHKSLDANTMASMVTDFRISSSPHENHVLWNGLSQDDIVETIIKLCTKY